jgi:hypothetical protein
MTSLLGLAHPQEPARLQELALLIPLSRDNNDARIKRLNRLELQGWTIQRLLPVDGDSQSVMAILQFIDVPKLIVVAD